MLPNLSLRAEGFQQRKAITSATEREPPVEVTEEWHNRALKTWPRLAVINSRPGLLEFYALPRSAPSPARARTAPNRFRTAGISSSTSRSASFALLEYDYGPVLRRGAEQRPGEFILRSADPSYGVRSGRWGFSRGAGPNQFRTAPLWGLGQRLFFLHDGRTSDLLKAIENHASPGSEANTAIRIFNGLTESQQ